MSSGTISLPHISPLLCDSAVLIRPYARYDHTAVVSSSPINSSGRLCCCRLGLIATLRVFVCVCCSGDWFCDDYLWWLFSAVWRLLFRSLAVFTQSINTTTELQTTLDIQGRTCKTQASSLILILSIVTVVLLYVATIASNTRGSWQQITFSNTTVTPGKSAINSCYLHTEQISCSHIISYCCLFSCCVSLSMPM